MIKKYKSPSCTNRKPIYVIYKTTNKINGKIYIGKQKYDYLNYFGCGNLISEALAEYGISAFEKEIIEKCDNYTQLNEREKYWIKFYNSTNRDIGYNIVPGGTYGDTITYHPDKENIVKRMSESRKGNCTGTKNSFYGRKHSNEAKQKIGKKNKESALRRNYTPEERQQKYNRGFGKDNPHYGKRHSDETKAYISAIKKGKNKVLREVRFCACGCGYSKTVKVTNVWKYKLGHNRRMETSTNNKR